MPLYTQILLKKDLLHGIGWLVSHTHTHMFLENSVLKERSCPWA